MDVVDIACTITLTTSFIFADGIRLSLEPACRSLVSSFHCTVVAIWFFFFATEGKGQLPILHSSSFLAGCNWIVFARKMHSTTKIAMTVLSKCVQMNMVHSTVDPHFDDLKVIHVMCFSQISQMFLRCYMSFCIFCQGLLS